MHEPLQDAFSLGRVRHFRMELDAVESASVIRDCRNRGGIRARHQLKSGRQFCDLVSMAHPHIQLGPALRVDMVLNVLQQP